MFKTASTLTLTEFNSRCTCTETTAIATVFAIGLTISVIVFTSIIIVLVKANKKAHRSDLASIRREQARLSSHEEPRRTTVPESTTTQEKMACSLALIWCAKTAQGVLISKSSTANVLNAHSSVLVINYHITNSTSDSAHWCVE